MIGALKAAPIERMRQQRRSRKGCKSRGTASNAEPRKGDSNAEPEKEVLRFVDVSQLRVVLNFNARVRRDDRRGDHHANECQGN